MADDVDIEEHDVLDNPRIKNIFPDITCIKTELINFEDKDINDFDEESYKKYQLDLTDPEILGCSVVLEDCGDSLKYNPCFCSDCEILFPTENAMNSHKMTAHSVLAVGRNKAKKSTSKSFISSIAARLKFETDSNMEISNLVNPCNKVFPDDNSVLKQLLMRKFYCDDCHLEFKSGISLKRHLRTHPTVLLYCCPICSCRFKFTKKIVSHMVKQHQVDVENVPQLEKTTFECPFCPKILRDIKSYNIHIQYRHLDLYKKIVKDKTHIEKLKSQPCNLPYPLKSCIGSNAARLKSEVDLNMELSNLSTYCNQVFPDEKSSRKFICYICDLEFESKISLQQHFRSLSGCLLFCCPICSCYFELRNEIVWHMVNQHQVDVENVPQPEKTTFECRFCPEILRNIKSYNFHINKVHTEQCKKIFKDKITETDSSSSPVLTFPSAYSEKIHRVSQHAIETEAYAKSVDLDKEIKIEPLSLEITQQVSQHVIRTYSKSVSLDKQIKIEPL